MPTKAQETSPRQFMAGSLAGKHVRFDTNVQPFSKYVNRCDVCPVHISFRSYSS